MPRLQSFAKNVWIAEGPKVDFYGFPYPTRMVIIRLDDGTSWIWSPVALDEELAAEVEQTAGPVRHLVSPNVIHWLFLKSWQDRFPQAKTYASPGLADRKCVQGIKFDATLTNTADPAYANDIDQFIFEGFLNEVIFFHKPSKTLLVCDLIQRHPEDDVKPYGWKGWIMKADGLVGPNGGAPGELRLLFWMRGWLPRARKYANRIILEWQPEKLIIAHGENAEENATAVVAASFATWIPDQPREPCSCCARTQIQAK